MAIRAQGARGHGFETWEKTLTRDGWEMKSIAKGEGGGDGGGGGRYFLTRANVRSVVNCRKPSRKFSLKPSILTFLCLKTSSVKFFLSFVCF